MANITPKRRSLFVFIGLILLFPFYLISKLITKDKQLYIFGSSLGYHFADNSKYLFLYVNEHVRHIRSVFISKNKDVVKFIKSNGMNAEYLYSLAGLRTIIRARKAFISHSIEDIHPVLTSGSEVIQLWHGTPLKMIGYDADWINDNGKDKIRKLIKKTAYSIIPYLYSSRCFDKIVISSDFNCPSFKSAFNISETIIDVMGQSRNDSMSRDYNFDEKCFPEIKALEHLKKRFEYLISWLPTHRKPASVNILNLMNDYKFDIDAYNEKLRSLNALLLLKPHFLELEIAEHMIKDKSNILIYREVDPYPLLRFTDILITDYSSIFFDFLIMNRPIIFTPFDFDDYIKSSGGLYYDYDEVTPGPKCYDWIEVMKEIEASISFINRREEDSYAKERLRVNGLFNKYNDGFSKRIVDNYFVKNDVAQKKNSDPY